MSPSKKAKQAGLRSLAQVSEMTDTSTQTLGNWARYKKKLFDIVLAGCASKIQNAEKVNPDGD